MPTAAIAETPSAVVCPSSKMADLALRSRRVLKRLEATGRPAPLKRYREQIDETADRIEVLRRLTDAVPTHESETDL
jgi:hypothetical protein